MSLTDTPLPTQGDTTWYDYATALDEAARGLQAQQAALAASAVTTDELVGSQVLTSFPTATTAVQSVTATNVLGIFAAPFPLEITKFSATWHYHSYVQNDTNYFRIRLYKRSAGIATVIATKTLQTTALGGQAVTALTPWTFDAVAWDTAQAQMLADDVLEVGFQFFGTGAVANAPVMFTWKYRPL